MNKLKDIHFRIDEETYNKLKKICKGDMTAHLQRAVKAYLWKVSWAKSRIPETLPNVCKLTNPKKNCVDYEMKIARNWCKDCIHWNKKIGG
jgi:hypothetical protein